MRFICISAGERNLFQRQRGVQQHILRLLRADDGQHFSRRFSVNFLKRPEQLTAAEPDERRQLLYRHFIRQVRTDICDRLIAVLHGYGRRPGGRFARPGEEVQHIARNNQAARGKVRTLGYIVQNALIGALQLLVAVHLPDRLAFAQPHGVNQPQRVRAVKTEPGIFPWIVRIRFIISHFTGPDQKALPGVQRVFFPSLLKYAAAGKDNMKQKAVAHNRAETVPGLAGHEPAAPEKNIHLRLLVIP